jgi:hypothetical protein
MGPPAPMGPFTDHREHRVRARPHGGRCRVRAGSTGNAAAEGSPSPLAGASGPAQWRMEHHSAPA